MVLKQKLIHLDSKFSTFLNNNDNFGTNITGAMTKNSAFYARHTLQSAVKNVRKIYLKSVEMPILFNNIRQGKTDRYSSDRVIVTFTKTGVTQTVTAILNETMMYADSDAVIAALNTKITNVANPNFTPVFSKMTISGDTKNILLTCLDADTITFTDTILSREMLGFNNDFSFIQAGYWFGIDRWNFNLDNYVNIFFENCPINNTNLSPVNSSFKLPINGVIGDVLFYRESDYFEQSVDIIDSNYVLKTLDILFTDRWGNRIYGFGSDYSMTLLVEYDE